MSRRTFLATSGALALAGSGTSRSAEPATTRSAASQPQDRRGGKLRKALLYSMLPSLLSVSDRLRLASDLGFEGVEVACPPDERTAEGLRLAADEAGIRIHSVMNAQSWQYPLSSSDPDTVAQGREILHRSLAYARILGADTVLLIPAVVSPEVRYKDAWQRSQKEIRASLPLARELGVTIAIENVGNRFLLSPLEFARYVDEIGDLHLQAYFDIGNSLMLWGYPQDWILTLGRRIRRMHLKDCDFGKKRFVLLREGDVDWPVVRRAIDEIGYSGFLTVEPNYQSPELNWGDPRYLARISERVDKIFGGE